MRKIIIFTVLLLSSFLFFQAFAQESSNYKLKEHAFNQGGHPYAGTILTAPNFKISIGSIGDIADRSQLNSDSFSMYVGFVSSFPPPGEVGGLHFLSDHVTLVWNPEKSKGDYNLYRGILSELSDYGTCLEYDIPTETTVDSEEPSLLEIGYFYLVTVKNRLDEEGTKGYSSDDERSNDYPCP